MPSGSLTPTEHWELSARQASIAALQQERQALLNEKAFIETRYGQIEQRLQSIPNDLAEESLMRESVVEKVGKRVGAKGESKTWKFNLGKEPKESTITWEESNEESSEGAPS